MTLIDDWSAERKKVGGLNWLVTCDPDSPVTFQMDRTTVETSLIHIESKKGKFDIESYEVDMWDIEQSVATGRGKSAKTVDKVIAENGKYVIPFWARESFCELMEKCVQDAEPVEISVSYVRTEDDDDLNAGEFELA